MRFQSKDIVNYMMHKLRLQTSAFQGEVNWQQMRQTLPELIPKGMENKMNFFLRAIAPIDMSAADYENYEFSKDDIKALCRSALHIMFR